MIQDENIYVVIKNECQRYDFKACVIHSSHGVGISKRLTFIQKF